MKHGAGFRLPTVGLVGPIPAKVGGSVLAWCNPRVAVIE
jgi:hypothetical protein